MSHLSTLRTRMTEYMASFRANRRKEDRGASIIEYGALIILIAAIASAVLAAGIADRPAAIINKAIDKVACEAGFEAGVEGECE